MKSKTESKDNISQELEKIYERMQKNEILFNMADDENLIEAAIYENRALNAQCSYLIKTAKEQGLKIEYTDRT